MLKEMQRLRGRSADNIDVQGARSHCEVQCRIMSKGLVLKRLGVRLQGLGLGFRAQQVEGLGLRSLGFRVWNIQDARFKMETRANRRTGP